MTGDDAAAPDLRMVDDRFWLGHAADIVAGTSGQRVTAAKELMSALAWLWTVYSGAAVLGTSVRAQHLGLTAAILTALPSVLIVCAYAAAMWAYLPHVADFDPRDPDQVRDAQESANRNGFRRLRIAVGLSAVAGLAIGVSIAQLAFRS